MAALPPVVTVPGSDEHEISGGRGRFTRKLAEQEAMPVLLPSLRLAVTV
jgi:hypothetical protein